MIKLGKLYINIFTLPLIFAAFLVSAADELALSYMVVTLHELAHYAAARRYKVGVSRLVVMPFGVYLQMRESIIENPHHECAVCAAGPICNAVLIVLGIILRSHIDVQYLSMTDYFIYTNISILLINLVPIVPLDGGRIMRALLTHRYGFMRAARITDIVSHINILLIGMLGIYVLYVTRFNVSVMLLCTFLLFNMSMEKKNNEVTLMRQIAYSKEKLARREIMPVRHLAAADTTPIRRVLKNFSYDSYYMVSIMDKNMNVIATVGETQIIDMALYGKKGEKLKVFGNNLSHPLVLERKIC